MEIISEDSEGATVRLNWIAVLGIDGALRVSLHFHRGEIHPLIGLSPEEAEPLRAEFHALMSRIGYRRDDAGLESWYAR